jgi:hypothetical protein
MDIVRDLLDAPLRDRRYRALGRVDGLVLELRNGAPPRLGAIESGPAVIANRVGQPLRAIVQWVARRTGVDLAARHFPMRLVTAIDLSITLDVDAKDEASLLAAEKWLSAHLRWGLFR